MGLCFFRWDFVPLCKLCFTGSLRTNIILHHIKKHYSILIINQSWSIKTIYFQIYFIYTIRWGWLGPIFVIFHDLLTHCNHLKLLDTQNIWHCALTLLIRKTLDLWSVVFLVFLACKHDLLFQKWGNFVLYWIWSSFHFFLSLQPHNSRSGPNLENQGSVWYWPKRALFFETTATKNFTTPYLIPLLSVLHQSKVLHNFHKRGQRPIARRIKGLH